MTREMHKCNLNGKICNWLSEETERYFVKYGEVLKVIKGRYN